MRFNGNVISNLHAAAKSQDEILFREILVDTMADMIETLPQEMIKTLRNSKVKVSDNASKKELVDLAAYNLHNNRQFQKNLAVTIVSKGEALPADYVSAVGQTGSGGGQSGGGGESGGAGWTVIVTSVADMVGSVGKWGSSSNDLKAEEERTKGRMYDKIFGQKQQRNWMPIIVIAGVLLIGGLVVWRTTKNA